MGSGFVGLFNVSERKQMLEIQVFSFIRWPSCAARVAENGEIGIFSRP